MKQYYIAEPGTSPHGPYHEDMVKRAFVHGMYPQGTLAWHEGASEWLPVEQFFTLPCRPSTPPPLPVIHSATHQSTQHQKKVAEKNILRLSTRRRPHGPYNKTKLLKAYAAGQYPADTQAWSNDTDGCIPLRKRLLRNMPTPHAPNKKCPHPASSSEKKNDTWLKLLTVILFVVVWCSIHSVGRAMARNDIAALFTIFISASVTVPALDVIDIKRRYGLTWKEARTSSFTFWGIAFPCLAFGFLTSTALDIPPGKNPVILFVMVMLVIASFIRIYLLKKKYKNRR